MNTPSIHSVHIPVMGLAYTIDTPIRVAHLGISSVISVMDDELIERMNCFYSKNFEMPYEEISKKLDDFRAKRITSYLNTVDQIVKKKFTDLKASMLKNRATIENYINILPSTSDIRKELQQYFEEHTSLDKLKVFIDEHLKPGDIDVNIMTKVDRENFNKSEALPVEYNDAHAALRGFAESNLSGSVVLSAGMNPRLFSYFENFECFYPQQENGLQKKIILKVSDFRSALIQGNFLAKKGLWVSEYRIESGLNCGGHAFATEGYLMGPILEEFKTRRLELISSTHEIICKALDQKGFYFPEQPLALKITAQGGVGTAQEHQFLLEHYQLDTVGWGSPFLLVPEATSVDTATRKLLASAKEEDLYLSDISPLGIPFNSIKGTTNEFLQAKRISQDKSGSSCPRKYLALNKVSYSKEGICTASRKYQTAELKKLEAKKEQLTEVAYQFKKEKITEKACLCIGLANASFLEHDLEIKGEAQGVVICPGPNIAYFTKEISLQKMMNHIYGRENIIDVENRPHFFIKELNMYLDHFRKEKKALEMEDSPMKIKKFTKLQENLLNGIAYYKTIFEADTSYFYSERAKNMQELMRVEKELLLN